MPKGVLQNEANISFGFNDEVGFATSIQTTEHERKITQLQRQLAEIRGKGEFEKGEFEDAESPKRQTAQRESRGGLPFLGIFRVRDTSDLVLVRWADPRHQKTTLRPVGSEACSRR